MNFNLILKHLRTDNCLTQTELAKKLNYTPSTISDWENQRSEPSIFQLTLLADFFGCSIDYLVGREDDLGNVVVQSPAVVLTKSENDLVSYCRQLSEERKTSLIDIAKGLALLEKNK